MQELGAETAYAIDANPMAVAKTVKRHPQLTVIETALGDYSGKTSFTQIIADRKDYEGSSSFIAAYTFPKAEYRTITVEVRTMKQVLEELGLENKTLDLVKVDLEGYTYEFLVGMGDALKRTKVLHLETETFNRHPGHKNNEEVKEFMINAGFTLEDLSYEWGPTIEDQIWVNSAIQ
jgi:FkbM family methyltransferase